MQKAVIAHISTVHPSNDGRIYFKECAALANSYEVHLIANGMASGAEGVQVHALKGEGVIARVVKKPIQILRIVQSIKAQVVHFHDPELMFLGVILKILGYKVIYDVHEDLPKQILYKPYLKSTLVKVLLSKLVWFTEQICSKFFDAIVVVTEDIQQKYAPSRTYLVRNYPITQSIITTTKTKFQTPLKLVYAGGLTRVRGILELLEATTLLPFEVEVHLYGKFNEAAYEQACKNSIGWTHVRFHGLLPMQEVYNELHNYDIGIGLLHPIKNYLTSLPVKAFEYMAAGITMLFSDFDYWQQTFGEYAYFADAQNPEDIAKAIQHMVTHQEEAFQKAEKGKAKITQEWSWEAEQVNLLEVYSRVVKV